MRELALLLDNSQLNSVTYGVATVTAIQASAGTVTVAMGARSLGSIPYLLSYSPAINDKIHMIISESTGMLVLGKSLAVAATAAPTQRTAFLVPNRSMTWQESRYVGESTVESKAVEGKVTQGSDTMYTYSGAYTYAAGQVTLAAKETIIRAELLIARVDDVHRASISPCLVYLQSFAANGKPIVSTDMCYMPFDLKPGEVAWAPMPISWIADVVSGAAKGVGLQTLSAQHAFQIAQFAIYTLVVMSTYTAGTLRLTIEKQP